MGYSEAHKAAACVVSAVSIAGAVSLKWPIIGQRSFAIKYE